MAHSGRSIGWAALMLVFLFGGCIVLCADDIYVDVSHEGPGIGTSAVPFSNLAQALALAKVSRGPSECVELSSSSFFDFFCFKGIISLGLGR
jgi:hypothetical protein